MFVVSTMDGGLCNCIKSFVSAVRMAGAKGTAKTTSRKLALCLASDVCMKWEDRPAQAEVVDHWRLVVLPEVDVEIQDQLNVGGEKSVSWDAAEGAKHVDFGYWLLPDPFVKRALKAWAAVRPSVAMAAYIDTWWRLQGLGSAYGGVVGVHVRSWGASHWDRAIGSWNGNRSFALEDYVRQVRQMAEVYDPKVFRWFLCVDHEQHVAAMKEALPEIGFVHHAFNKGLSFHQNAFVDLCMLSRCVAIIGKTDSTFTESAWWMGGCVAHVVLV